MAGCGCSEGMLQSGGGRSSKVTLKAIKQMSYEQLITYLKSQLKKSKG